MGLWNQGSSTCTERTAAVAKFLGLAQQNSVSEDSFLQVDWQDAVSKIDRGLSSYSPVCSISLGMVTGWSNKRICHIPLPLDNVIKSCEGGACSCQDCVITS